MMQALALEAPHATIAPTIPNALDACNWLERATDRVGSDILVDQADVNEYPPPEGCSIAAMAVLVPPVDTSEFWRVTALEGRIIEGGTVWLRRHCYVEFGPECSEVTLQGVKFEGSTL
jgi:hypothetical protein